jgi:soluble lytic murein transglycosylase-like protein
MATRTTDPVLAFAAAARRASARWHIPVAVLLGLISVESAGNPLAVSSAGARGSTQFMPGTAKGYGVQFGNSAHAIDTQVDGAAHYLHDLGYAKDPRKALASYNGGPGNPQYGYAAEVLQHASKYGHVALSATPAAATRPASTPTDTSPDGGGEWGNSLLSPLFEGAAKGLLYIALIAGGALLIGIGTHRALNREPA